MQREKDIDTQYSYKSNFITVVLGLVGTSVTEQENKQSKKDIKTWVVYFSFTTGNTKCIAEKVHNAVGGDIVRLETVKSYPSDYEKAVSQGNDGVKRGYKPELKPLGVNVKDYDRIIVGTPTWWYKMAPAVLTFMSDNDFTGEVVVPFMTSAGWPGTVIKDMAALARQKGATVQEPHEFRFSANEKHFNQIETPESDLLRWIERLK